MADEEERERSVDRRATRPNRDRSRTRLTSLQVGDSILEGHGPDSDAGIQLVLIEIEPPNSSSVDSSAFSLESTDEFDGLDLGSSRDGSGGEDGSEGVEPEQTPK